MTQPPGETTTTRLRLRERVAARLHRLGWPAAGLAVAALVALPVLVVAASVAFDSGGVWRHLVETVLPGYVENTLLLALGVGSISTAIGVACGWAIAMCRFPGHRFFSWALLLPLAVPSYLIAYSYSDLLQFSGPVQSWLRATFGWSREDYWFPQVRSLSGAIVMLSAVLYPYVYLAARTAFLEQSACALEVSRTLGMGPWRSFLRVALPLARPSIAAGASLVLMETVAEFGAVDYCAVDTFATGIYRTLTGLDSRIAASQLSAALLLFVGAALALERLSRGRSRHYHATYRYRALPQWTLRGWRGALACLVCSAPVLVGFVVPTFLFARMTWIAGDERARQLAWELGKNTFLLAAISSVIAVALAIAIAYGKRLRPTPSMKLAAAIAGLGYAIPGAVVAIGVLIPAVWIDHRIGDAIDWMFSTSTGLAISGTIAAVVFAYQVRFLGVSLGVVEGGLTRIRRSLDDAAQTLGASRTRTLLRVHLPLLRGSLLAAALLVFADVAKELPATLVLRPFDFDTLAVRVHRLASDERLPEASTGALMIILVGLIPVFLLSRAIAQARPGSVEAAPDIRIRAR